MKSSTVKLERNAIKYAGGDGPIDVTAAKRNGMLEIEVRGAGQGFRGCGLEVAIVKTCVEACKKTVPAANRQPEGFTVKIIL